MVEARDAEHAAESKAREEALRADVLKLQDDLLQAANREVALEATIERLGDNLGGMNDLVVRLKGELAEARRLMDKARMQNVDVSVIDAIDSFLAAPLPAESPTFEQLVERVGPLPTTQLAGAAESTGVMKVFPLHGPDVDAAMQTKAKCRCDGKGWPRRSGPPTKCMVSNPCAFDGPPFMSAPAAPPDDIRDRVEQLEAWRDGSVAWGRGAERRLEELEAALRNPNVSLGNLDLCKRCLNAAHPWAHSLCSPCPTAANTTAPAAPQEQAGHAFNDYWRNGKCAHPDCGKPKDNPIHTGAKP
jgi:hypothetical protein